MAMATGIDKLGQSLLSQSTSKRKQLRDDVKKQQKRARNIALWGAGLKFVDGIVRDRHANWFEGEANRNATRFLKQHETYLTEREQYEENLRKSGKSALDYEISLLKTALPENKLKMQLPYAQDISDLNWTTLLHGSGTEEGFYTDLAKQRLKARDDWKKNLKDLPDPVTEMQEWQKLNPRSRNLLHGAYNFFKNKLSGSPNSNSQQLLDDDLKEIRSNASTLETFYNAREVGFSSEQAIKTLKNRIKSPDIEKIGKAGTPTRIEVEKVVTFEDGTKGTVKVPVDRIPYTRSDGHTYYKLIPTSQGTVEEKEASKDYVKANHGIASGEVTITHPITGLSVKVTTYGQVDEKGDFIEGTMFKKFSDPTAWETMQDPTAADLTPAAITSGFTAFSNSWTKLVKLHSEDEELTVDDFIQVQPYTPVTKESKDKAVKTALGARIALIVDELDGIGDKAGYDLKVLGFSRQDKNLIAGQLLLMDDYSYQNGQSLFGYFKGRSKDNIDPGKLILAIDLLRSRGQLNVDHLGGDRSSILTHKKLVDRLDSSKFWQEHTKAFSHNEAQDGEPYYSQAEAGFISEIRTLIQKAGRKDFSLLEARPKAKDTEPPFDHPTVYESMIMAKPGTWIQPPPPGTTNDIDKGDTTGLLNYLGGVAIEAANFFPSLRKSSIDDQTTTDDSLLDSKTPGFTLRKVNKFLQKDLYPEGYEPKTPEEIKVAGVGSKATRDFRVSRFRALEPLIPDAQARHDVIDNASRFLEAFETEEGAVNQIQLLKEKINLLDTTDMTLGAVNRRVEGIDIGILGISEDTARKIAGIDTANKIPSEGVGYIEKAKKRGLFN